MFNFLILVLLLIGFAQTQSCTCQKVGLSAKIDGSSTVYVLSEAIAEEYKNQQKGRISIGISGTGGGFKKLCTNRINLIGASRRVKKSEEELCAKNNVKLLEFPVAYDGIVVVVHKNNNFISTLDTNILKKIFEPAAENKINFWSDIKPQWPKQKIALFAPGVSSGTYDYFTKAIVGTEHASRGDMTTSEDDNVLVHGVKNTLGALGFFSFAYYLENKDDLKAVAIINNKNNPAKPVFPTRKTIQDKTYSPLSRSVFLYANSNKLNSADEKALRFYLKNSPRVSQDVGFIPLSKTDHQKILGLLKGL